MSASPIVLGVLIGASLRGGMTAVNQMVGKVGATVQGLSLRQQQLAADFKKPMGADALGKLKHDYEQVGDSLAKLRLHQKAFNANLQEGAKLKGQREKLWGGFKAGAATAATAGTPLVGAVRQAIDFQASMRHCPVGLAEGGI